MVNLLRKSLHFAGVALAVLTTVVPALSATLLPNGEQTFVDANGAPFAGGSVFMDIPSTSTPKTTWKDSAQTTPNTNPIILDAAGRAIIYGNGTYRQILKDVFGNTIWDQLTTDTAAGGVSFGGTTTGAANTQIAAGGNFGLVNGSLFSFIAGFTNTGPTTLAASGQTTVAIDKDLGSGPSALVGGEIVAGNQVTVLYDSVLGVFHMVSLPPAGQPAPSGVRQTVASGPTDAALGTPTFLPASSVSLTLATQNITASVPLVVTAAAGVGASSQATDFPCIALTNFSWTLPASSTNFLYLTVNQNGTCTPGSTTSAPVYSNGIAIANTNGLYTFDTSHYQMWLGTGVTVNQQLVVFVGQAVTTGSAVSSAIAYAYQGRYTSIYTTGLPGLSTTTVAQSNIGTDQWDAVVQIRNVTPEFGYAAGEVVRNLMTFPATGVPITLNIGGTNTTTNFTTGGFASWGTINRAAPTSVATLTLANWAYRVSVKRQW